MKICPAELAEVCREETSLGRPLADPLPRGGRQLADPLPRGDQGTRGSPLTGLAPRPLVPPGQGVGSLPSPPRRVISKTCSVFKIINWPLEVG